MALSYESLLKLGCWCHYSILQPMPRIFTHPTYLPTHPPTHPPTTQNLPNPQLPEPQRAHLQVTKVQLQLVEFLRGHPANRTLACISRTRHARCPQRVARAPGESHSRLHFAHSTRTISAEGCAGSRQIALSPAFRALDTHDLRRALSIGY